MERLSSFGTGQKIAVTIGVSAGAALLYLWYCRHRTVPQEEELEVTMKVPKHFAELILGRDGGLPYQSGARIEVTSSGDNGGGDLELRIRGSPKHVRHTQQLLHGILQDGATLRVELYFPSSSIGRIIGKDGERIQEITRRSGAEIQCERRKENNMAAQTRLITVTGAWEQVAAAKTLLQKASEEVAAVQRRAAESSSFRSHRKETIAVKKDKQRPQEEREKKPPSMGAPRTISSAEDLSSEDNSPVQENMSECDNICKFEVPSPDFSFRADEYVDVYVSATENPDHFWVQILGSRFSQLDKLTTEMSDHYQRQKRGSVPKIQVGDIVAAPFPGESFWYRAQVLGFLENGKVDLYYVDYGDSRDMPKNNLFPLRSDFLSLPFQAIECRLSGIAPQGGTWSDQAVDAFDALSYCAQWRPMLAKVSSFPSAGVSRYFQICLYDPFSDPMIDIAVELVRRGYAVESRTSPMSSDEDESLVSRLMEDIINPTVQSEDGSFVSRQEEGSLASDAHLSSSDDVILIED